MKMIFTQTGERVTLNESNTFMYVEPDYPIKSEDRITILTSDDSDLINQLYLVMAVYPEWGSMGLIHHQLVELQIH
jgi:hypothetical protein